MNPEYRSRLVAKEINMDNILQVFSISWPKEAALDPEKGIFQDHDEIISLRIKTFPSKGSVIVVS